MVSPSSLSFHPATARWFADTLGEPTVAQRRGWASIRDGRHTLIAAPTGSGKTLAAFLTTLDDLLQEGLRGPLADEVRVVYVSPLKALSADIHKNLSAPRRGIRRQAEDLGLEPPRITAAVRTGDTSQAERAAMLRTPPHILVTTPESLYLLLTADRSRAMLRTVRTVIVDEIHAVIGTRRGAHLALSLERLAQVAESPLLRIGLSATQNPVEEVARFLVGTPAVDAAGCAACAIVDEGHRRDMDLGLELPRSPLEAVMSNEVWEEYYGRLAELIAQHRTTLVFVNTRRMAERVARHLSDRLGDGAVTAHHGSLSKEKRLDAEARLKSGQLKALVATASLELGIDIGHVDLACQIGSPHRIATLIQRIGRSGHTVSGVPKGRLFPISRDDLIESVSLLRAIRRGHLDRIVAHDSPLDVLTQQVVAETACREYADDELFDLVRRAWPFRDLDRQAFDAVVAMAADGFHTRRGRRGALLHRDEVHGRLRGRRGARLLALTSGGAIPEVADYRVVLEPEDLFLGTLNEDFAIESMAGDVFQLGNASWRVLRVGSGTVRVADAKGSPPTIPFWLGEAPARSDELSREVSDLRAEIEARLADTARESAGLKSCATTETESPDTGSAGLKSCATTETESSDTGSAGLQLCAATETESSDTGSAGLQSCAATETESPDTGSAGLKSCATTETESSDTGSAGLQSCAATETESSDTGSAGLQSCAATESRTVADSEADAVALLQSEAGIDAAAAEQAVAYLADARRTLGVLPTQEVLVLERFFDESGGMQLVLHAPFGSRINKAWGLALRKRFCRQFNFELQAAATEDALLLSLGPQHSFPLADVFRYLHPATARDVLVQAFLDAPVFQTRWRWNTTISLAIPRNRSGRKVPPQLQRAMADDLMAAVFPDAAACLENIPGDRQIPDHPLVMQTVRDCLQEAMDFEGLAAVLARIHRGELRLVSRDTPEPSSLAHEILNARPYAFLDDAPLEERRTQAVYTRRSSEPASADDLGALDASAIERVRDEVRPDPRDADELHDALLTAGFFTAAEAAADPDGWLDRLIETRRAARVNLPRHARGAGPKSCATGITVAGATGTTVTGATGATGACRAGLQSCAGVIWVAAERLPEIMAVHPNAAIEGQATAPASRAARVWSREQAMVELVRGRLTIAGPTTASAIGTSLSIDADVATAALISLESEGAVLRGSFTAGTRELEWCDRRLLARIHRYTLNRLRAEIDPVSPADFMRFLFAWQHVAPSSRLAGVDGLRSVIAALDGFELAASAWERAVLPARVDRYEPSMLDMLCLAGDVGWARLSVPTPTEAAAVVRLGGTTPIALFLREHGDVWQTLRHSGDEATGVEPRGQDRGHKETTPDNPLLGLTPGAAAAKVLAALRARGASFLRELAAACGMDDEDAASALGDLVAAGLVTSDGFAGLRAIVRAAAGKRGRESFRRANSAGRWSLLRRDDAGTPREPAVEAQARALLRRYGVVFRRLLTREANAAPWRELARTYRRLEARGEIRGGRFVSGMSGEQFALPDAVNRLREIRRTPADGRLITISAADPLNVTGIITVGERVRAIETSRIVYRDGVPMAALQGDYLRPLAPIADAIAADVASVATGRRMPAIASGFVGQ